MRPPRAAVVLAALLLAPAACSSPPPGPHVVSPPAWAKSVCQALQPWRTRLNDLTARAQREMASTTTPAQTKKNLVEMLAGAERASEDARERVAAAGLPDVTSGRHIADRYVNSLAVIRDAYARARRTIDALDTSDAAAFYARVDAAWQILLSEYNRGGLETAKGSSPELRRAFDEVPECR